MYNLRIVSTKRRIGTLNRMTDMAEKIVHR